MDSTSLHCKLSSIHSFRRNDGAFFAFAENVRNSFCSLEANNGSAPECRRKKGKGARMGIFRTDCPKAQEMAVAPAAAGKVESKFHDGGSLTRTRATDERHKKFDIHTH